MKTFFFVIMGFLVLAMFGAGTANVSLLYTGIVGAVITFLYGVLFMIPDIDVIQEKENKCIQNCEYKSLPIQKEAKSFNEINK